MLAPSKQFNTANQSVFLGQHWDVAHGVPTLQQTFAILHSREMQHDVSPKVAKSNI